jgi:hypothetical protein
MLKRRVVALSVILSLLSLPVAAQSGSGDMLSRIRETNCARKGVSIDPAGMSIAGTARDVFD